MKKIEIKLLLISIILSTNTGCHTSKSLTDSNVFETQTLEDSLSLSSSASALIRETTEIDFEEYCSQAVDVFDFVENGGAVSVATDGSVLLSGVATFRSGRSQQQISTSLASQVDSELDSTERLSVSNSEKSVSHDEVSSEKSRDVSKRINSGIVITILFILSITVIALTIWHNLKK